MNKIVNKFLLAEDKFTPEMHVKQLGFIYNADGLVTKNNGRIQTFMETRDIRYIYQNELDKASLQHDMAYRRRVKDLVKKTESDKVLRDKAFQIAYRLLVIQDAEVIKED